MKSFLARFTAAVRGVLSGFDRLFLCGSLRGLSYCRGLQHYLWANRIAFKDFKAHSLDVTQRLQQASLRHAQECGREIRYLNSAQHSKEEVAREIAERDRIKEGLICVLRSVDPCMSFQINKNHTSRKLEIHYRPRKCLHLYHYQIHPIFGFMHARIQTWFPFRIHVCINGREWLARQMDQVGLKYSKRRNTFTWLQDIPRAQALLDEQLQANWPSLLSGVADALNPIHHEIFAKAPLKYYWSVQDSEWASDIMFRSRADLEDLFPRLVRHAMTSFGAADMMRFLGKQAPASGKVPHRHRHEVYSNVKERLEGVRVKHWVNDNSIKMYDKWTVLRAETTICAPQEFKVYRDVEGRPEGFKDWRPMRRGIADLRQHAVVGQQANERYLEALSAVHDATPLRQLAEPLCQRVEEPARQSVAVAATTPTRSDEEVASLKESGLSVKEKEQSSGSVRRVRALNPLGAADAALLTAVSRHEFMIRGLRNREVRALLYGEKAETASEQRRQSASVTRQLRLLRAHGLIEKVEKTHRYVVTDGGRRIITALLAARNASTDELTRGVA